MIEMSDTLICLFLISLMMHGIADYTLQGILASMKQRIWWVNELIKHYKCEDEKLPSDLWMVYRFDFIPALLMHSYMWAFMIILPYGLYMLAMGTLFTNMAFVLFIIIANMIIHAFVDHLKANVGILNLVEDQIIHLLQLIVTSVILL